MTYKELLEKLKEFTPEQLSMDVTVFCCDEVFSHGDEFYPIDCLLISSRQDDILDKDHPYLLYYK